MALGQLIPDGTTLTTLENVLYTSGRKWGGFLYTETRDVFIVAALVMLTWHVVRFGLARSEGQMFDVLPEILEKLFVMSIVAAMFIKGTAFVDYVVAAGNGLATASGGNNAFDAIFGQMGKAIVTMWDAWNELPVWEMSDPLSMGALVKKIVAAVMVLLGSLLILVIGAVLIFTMLAGSFILAFAMASGPIVWAFALLPPTAFMVNGWIKLLATGFFTKLVAVLCIDMAVTAVTTAISPSTMPTNAAMWLEPVNIFANLAQMVVLLLLVVLLVLFARGMAAQLVAGNASTDLWQTVTSAASSAGRAVAALNGRPTQSSGSTRGGGSQGGGSNSGGSTNGGSGSGAGGSVQSGPPSMTAHTTHQSSGTSASNVSSPSATQSNPRGSGGDRENGSVPSTTAGVSANSSDKPTGSASGGSPLAAVGSTTAPTASDGSRAERSSDPISAPQTPPSSTGGTTASAITNSSSRSSLDPPSRPSAGDDKMPSASPSTTRVTPEESSAGSSANNVAPVYGSGNESGYQSTGHEGVAEVDSPNSRPTHSNPLGGDRGSDHSSASTADNAHRPSPQSDGPLRPPDTTTFDTQAGRLPNKVGVDPTSSTAPQTSPTAPHGEEIAGGAERKDAP